MAVLQLHQVAEPEIKPASDKELRSTRDVSVYYTTVAGVIHLMCNMYNSICGDDYPICLSGSIGGALSELVAVC